MKDKNAETDLKTNYPDPTLDLRGLGIEVRDLAGERWADVSDQAPTLYAVWGGGATPAQALHMIGLILPPKAA
jgi:hypothetical protein